MGAGSTGIKPSAHNRGQLHFRSHAQNLRAHAAQPPARSTCQGQTRMLPMPSFGATVAAGSLPASWLFAEGTRATGFCFLSSQSDLFARFLRRDERIIQSRGSDSCWLGVWH